MKDTNMIKMGRLPYYLWCIRKPKCTPPALHDIRLYLKHYSNIEKQLATSATQRHNTYLAGVECVLQVAQTKLRLGDPRNEHSRLLACEVLCRKARASYKETLQQ